MITPQNEIPELAKVLGVPRLFMKREDLHPYGSHKGRSIAYMIDAKNEEGAENFAISSSGNAALAALRHIQKRNKEEGKHMSLSILTGRRINPEKKKRLMDEITDDRVTVSEEERPLQTLTKLVKTGMGIESLRQSTDEEALVGYQSLAFEIAGTPDLAAVFVGTSSGTTAQALADYFVSHSIKAEIHIVQTTGTSPIARSFDEEEAEGASLADAIVDKVAHRRGALVEAIEKTQGSGWIVNDAYIKRAIALLAEQGIDATANGALGLAGLLKARDKGRTFKGSVVCIITGR